MEYPPNSYSVNDARVGANQAVTDPINRWKKSGASNIFIRRAVLESDKRLFYTLDHELTYAELFSDRTMAKLVRAAGKDYAIRHSEIMSYYGGIKVGQAWNDNKVIMFSIKNLLEYFNKK